MGMIQNIDLKGTQKERDVMTPTRLSLILGIETGTMYKAFRIVGTGTWGVNLPLSVADVDALILYYSNLGNETAIKLAESRQKPTETEKESTETKPEISTPATETEKERKETKPNRLSLLDVVFWFTVCLAGWGFYTFLGNWGIGVWVVYALIAVHAMIMARNPNLISTARAGLAAVIVLEIVTFFVHLAMFNLAIWRLGGNLRKGEILPFRVYEHLEYPFYIALVLAALLSAASIYAVAVRMGITMELSKPAK